MGRALEISVDVPDAVSEESRQLAAARGREAIVLTLQQSGELTLGAAAEELGLTYDGYLRLLAERGLPACHDSTTPRGMGTLRRALR